jgi:hypothetical protein
MPPVQPAFLNTNVNFPTLNVYSADKGINNEENKFPLIKQRCFVDSNLCPSLLYLTKRKNYEKKEFNFKFKHPVACRQLVEEMK